MAVDEKDAARVQGLRRDVTHVLGYDEVASLWALGCKPKYSTATGSGAAPLLPLH